MPGPDLTPLFSADPQRHAYDVYRELREQAPVHKVPGRRTWLLSTYDDVRAVVRDPATWSSHYPEQFGDGLAERGPDTPRTRAALAKGYPWVPTLLFQDGTEHRRHRVALQQALNAASIRRLERQIEATAHALVDAFAADGDRGRETAGASDAGAAGSGAGTAEFVRDFAMPLPISVFADAFGVAPGDRERFARWSQSIVELGAAADEDESVAVIEQYVEFQQYIVERIGERREQPGGDDLLAGLVDAQAAGGVAEAGASGAGAAGASGPGAASGRRAHDRGLLELLGICTLLLAAGNDTTTAGLSSLLYRMIEDPQLMATLRADRSQIPAAVEETLRLDSPVQMFQRKANRDTEIGGHAIQRGDMAMVIYASANRDPAHWDDADAFRLDRPNIRDHVAFTHGPHHCAGAILARAQLRIGTEVLLDRIDDIRLDTSHPLDYLPNLMTRSFRALPLTLSLPFLRS